MLGKCVHWVSGIETKQIVKVDHHNGFDFYMLRADYENDDGFQRIYFEYDGHFFPISSNKEHIKQFLNENPDFNLIQWITEDFEKSLVTGANISRGYAEYLGRTEEAKQAVAAFRERKRIESEKKEEERKQRELERLKVEQERLQQVEQKYITGESISGDDFLKLCDKHDITVPIRTRGWIINSLSSISFTYGSVNYSYCGNASTSIGKVAQSLYNALTQEDETGEDYATEDELDHLFGFKGYQAAQ